MKSRVYFKEEQTIDVWWMKFLLLFVLLATLVPVYYGLFRQLSTGEPWGDKPVSDSGLIILSVALTVIMAGVLFLVFGSKLITKVYPEGIYITLSPFFKNKFIPKEKIKEFEIRKYRPIMEYGGYGLRYSVRNGKAYNMGGNTGLQLHFTDGEKLLIGTRHPEQLKEAVKKMMAE
ncbi:MAG: hypothetical protein GXO47_03315 [Chlorobi bacterium]|nr:hypothetical protein [Chlorobiota bacterium]